MALHLPTTEQWLKYRSCLEAGQRSTRKVHETIFWKVVQEYVSYLVDEMGKKIATSSLVQNFFLCSATSSRNSPLFAFKNEDKRGDIKNDILSLLLIQILEND